MEPPPPSFVLRPPLGGVRGGQRGALRGARGELSPKAVGSEVAPEGRCAPLRERGAGGGGGGRWGCAAVVVVVVGLL